MIPFSFSVQAYDRCYATLGGSCDGASAYEIDLPGQASSLHEESCVVLSAPCDSGALASWISVHVQAKRSLSGSITNAAIRGSLLNTATKDVNEAGKFRSFAGKAFSVCFQAEGQPTKLIRQSSCPALPKVQPCRQGTVAAGTDCLLPATVHEVDPQGVVNTLVRANEALTEAKKQTSENGRQVEADGATKAVITPPGVAGPASESAAPSGVANAIESRAGGEPKNVTSPAKGTWVSPELK